MAHSNFEYTTGRLPIVIFLSFIIASALSVYPLSPHIASLHPMLMIMVLIFWLLFQPRYVGIFTAFTIGVVIDLLMDTRLGQHAFAAVMVTLVMQKTGVYIKSLTMVSAWFMAILGLVAFQLSLWLLQLMTQDSFAIPSALPLLVSIISWPLLYLVLRRFT
ncbi:rod shape-determining protein MreD [Psychrobacter urativorans]|uniref:Rod shape-determining protein MreD n=1 Tax=Psychrobacter urativorans TaxID=45610 RepID=A0A0M4U406_9GAMM|nr:rod shape-determining protein MreD [Psychrobacter urativorans]ALF59294.1 rod shape-determining protein MreD [Psychrobacter urativorans]